jgi:hypothetical protein
LQLARALVAFNQGNARTSLELLTADEARLAREVSPFEWELAQRLADACRATMGGVYRSPAIKDAAGADWAARVLGR